MDQRFHAVLQCLSEEISGNRVYTNSGEPRYQDAYTASQPRGCQGRSPVVFCWQQKTKTPSAVLSDIFCENLCTYGVESCDPHFHSSKGKNRLGTAGEKLTAYNLKTIIGKNAAWNFLRRQVSLILHLSNPPAGSVRPLSPRYTGCLAGTQSINTASRVYATTIVRSPWKQIPFVESVTHGAPAV